VRHSIEEEVMRSVGRGLSIAARLKFVQILTALEVGILVADVHIVVEDFGARASAQSEGEGERKYQELKAKFMDRLERRQRLYARGEADPGDKQVLLNVLWFNHPILNLMLHSMSVASDVQTLLFMLAFSGTAATSALFFVPTAAPPDCEVPENFWAAPKKIPRAALRLSRRSRHSPSARPACGGGRRVRKDAHKAPRVPQCSFARRVARGERRPPYETGQAALRPRG